MNRAGHSAVFLLAVVAGCSGAETVPSTFAVRDSAGVTIVESSGPAWQPQEGWRLSAAPLLTIGAVEGDEEYLLVRPWSSVRLADGAIVVANNGTQELRWYDTSGRFLKSAGGRGEGPGEFIGLWSIIALGEDSIVAHDERLARIAIFDSYGTFARSARLANGGGSLHGAFSDGTLLIGEDIDWSSYDGQGRVRLPARTYRVDTDGAVCDSLPTFVSREFLSASVAPLGRRTEFAVISDAFFVGTQESREVSRYGQRGALQAIVRWPAEDRQLTEEHIAAYRAYELSGIDGENMKLRVAAELDKLEYPELLPAHGGIVVDADGNLWVEDYSFPWADRRRWTVFDADLKMLGSVEMPDIDVDQIGSDFVLGHMYDELDVEYVVLYKLIKN
jgi:hypothetical protein